MQRGDHIEQAVVPCCAVAFFGELIGDEKSEDAEAIVDGDEDHAFERKEVAVVARLIAAAAGVAAAVNPEHDGQLALVGCVGGRVNVQEEAIFAGPCVLKDHVVEDATLRAVSAELGRVARALPFGRCFGSLPAQIADRRRRIGKAQKCLHLAVVDCLSLDLALLCFHLERVSIRVHREPENQQTCYQGTRIFRTYLHSKSSAGIPYQDGWRKCASCREALEQVKHDLQDLASIDLRVQGDRRLFRGGG